jgi:tetratricopeptide (TPR) repeat protein
MDKDHALALLGKKLGGDSDKKYAAELAQSLDYMPLAITQAAAYISQRAPRYTVSRYLNDIRGSDKGRAGLLNKDVGDSRRDGTASNSIMATWQISFEHIRKEKPSAARLLSLMSLFDRQGIPEYLLCKLADVDNKADILVDTTDKSAIDFEEDIHTLISYSLISSNIEGNVFEMHRLVQFSTKKWLGLYGEIERWKERYIMIMDRAFPEPEYENWTACQAMFPHAEVVLAYRPLNRKYLAQWATILSNAASYARDKGSYTVAEQMEQEALESRRELLGEEHPDTLTSMSNLALVLRRQGKYNEAEEMNRRTLELTERVLGKEHPDTLTSMSNLALVLRRQGKYNEAEEMNRQTLELRERVLGKEHPDTLASMSNLVLVLNSEEKYNEAEEMNRRTLELMERVLGKEHPETLTSIYCLAHLLQSQKRYSDSSILYQRALLGYQKKLGLDHPITLACSKHYSSLLEEIK